MTEFLCSTYARLARSLMEMYHDTRAAEILSVSAGVSCPDNGAVEIHRAMAKTVQVATFAAETASETVESLR
jgi:hypothetical protein